MNNGTIRDVPSDVRVAVVNALIHATVDVVQTMTGVTVERKDVEVRQGLRSSGDVTGIIGLTSESLDGTLAVSFSAPCILALVSALFGEPVEELGDDVADAVGEFTNIISGKARANLSQRGFQFDMAVPMVVTRRDHRISVLAGQTVIVIPFGTENGAFCLEICLNPRAVRE